MNTTTYVRATDKQIAYAFKLAVQAGMHTADQEADFVASVWIGINAEAEQTSRRTFSTLIDTLQKQVAAKRATTPPPAAPKPAADVPAGYYALTHPTEGKIYFFKVDKPTEGRWAGYTFVKRVSGDNELRVDRADVPHILRMIAASPLEAAMLYGQETKVCGMCHTRLTDEKSRKLGIGPNCIKNHFGMTQAQAIAARGTDAYWDAEIQRHERAEDEAVAEYKANRDKF